MKQNKIFNLILEYSQILLVFLGVFLSLECLIKPLSFTVNEGALAIVLMITSVLFYAFFTVLETLRRGKAKAYGFVGILVFFLLVLVTFFDIIKKGCITILAGLIVAGVAMVIRKKDEQAIERRRPLR